MQTGIAHNETKQLLNSRLQELNESGFKSVLLAHFGEINQDLINSFTVSVEEMMVSAGDRKPLIKRVFSILIEGLQNILIHGEHMDDDQLALVIVASNEDNYRIVLGNFALAADKEKLVNYLDKLNSMDEEDVKAYYLEILNNGLISTKGGAGLGFITMRMKSKSQLRYTFGEVNDTLMFFTIGTDLDRKAV